MKSSLRILSASQWSFRGHAFALLEVVTSDMSLSPSRQSVSVRPV